MERFWYHSTMLCQLIETVFFICSLFGSLLWIARIAFRPNLFPKKQSITSSYKVGLRSLTKAVIYVCCRPLEIFAPVVWSFMELLVGSASAWSSVLGPAHPRSSLHFARPCRARATWITPRAARSRVEITHALFSSHAHCNMCNIQPTFATSR